jgi:hypothetical protein
MKLRMNKLFLFLVPALVLLCGGLPVFAADVTQNLAFEWEQDPGDLPQLAEWRFQFSTTAGGPYQPWLDDQGNQVTVVYDPANPGPTYNSPEYNITLDIPPGSSVTYYFVLVAVDHAGLESDVSTEALNPDGSTGVVFKAPIGKPFSFSVSVTIVTPQ